MISRRAMVAVSALAVAAGRSGTAKAALTPNLAASGAGKLKAWAERLSKAPRRRNFKSAPMILTEDNQWCDALLHFLLTSASRRLTLPPNRFCEEQFSRLGDRSIPRRRTVVSWIKPKSARIQLATLALTREAHDESSLASSLVFSS